MGVDPGPLIATGRAADVFDQGDGTVLRRYRTEHDCAPEGRLMSWLHAEGFLVPRIELAEGTDIVMERIDGPTMLVDLQQRPWTVVGCARLLAELQSALASLVGPDWLAVSEFAPDGSAVLHGDLHPMNVILSVGGPVVIDWTNARRGSAGFDAAMSYVLMSAYEVAGIRDRVGQRALCWAFERARGPELRGFLAEACERLLGDPNATEGEKAAARQIRAGAETQTRPGD